MRKITTLCAAAAIFAVPAIAGAAPSCAQLTRQYTNDIEPVVSRFIDMTDSGKQCTFGNANKKKVRDFTRSFDAACKGNSSGKTRTAKEDLATFSLTLRSICGP